MDVITYIPGLDRFIRSLVCPQGSDRPPFPVMTCLLITLLKVDLAMTWAEPDSQQIDLWLKQMGRGGRDLGAPLPSPPQ